MLRVSLAFLLSGAVLALAASASAQGFTPEEFFGEGCFSRDDAGLGSLRVPLTEEGAPRFLILGTTDGGDTRQRFLFSEGGLKLAPSGRRQSCEAAIDFGVYDPSVAVTLSGMEEGAALGLRLNALDPEKDGDYLIELLRREAGLTLRLRAWNGRRWTTLPDAEIEGIETDWPVSLEIRRTLGTLSAAFGENRVEALVALSGGCTTAVIASDAAVSLSALSITGTPASLWVADASVRLQARRALSRLREFAHEGALLALTQAGLPGREDDLKGYTEIERARRIEALQTSDYGLRLAALLDLADAHPGAALARHEAGVAALLAGDPALALDHLQAARGVQAAPATDLALAEAQRRLGLFGLCEISLNRAEEAAPEDLKTVLAVTRARLHAARGNLREARKLLEAASSADIDNAMAAAFADSALELLAPSLAMAHEGSGPFGLDVYSDLPEGVLAGILVRLADAERAVRNWLPELPEKLEGSMAIYASATGYLRAALLAAGDRLDNVAGMYVPRGPAGRPLVLGCREFGEDELVRTLSHELWHLAFACTPGGRNAPSWLDEGMAVWLSTTMVDGDALPAEFANAETDIAELLDDPDAMKSVLAADAGGFYASGRIRDNYALAWVVIWYHAEAGMEPGARLRSWLKGDFGETDDLPRELSEQGGEIKRKFTQRWLR